jgi:hypothetical protein
MARFEENTHMPPAKIVYDQPKIDPDWLAVNRKYEPMKELKKKIILESLVSKTSISAWVIGSTFLFGGWAVGSALTAFGGFSVVSVGFAWSLTNLTMRYDSIKSRVMAQIKKDILYERNKKLDELDRKLCSDKDPRDQNALRELRTIYQEFDEFADAGRIPDHIKDSMSVRVNELFESCVKNLQTCYDLWDTSRSLQGKSRQKLLSNREAILLDVISCVENFTNVVTSLMTATCKNGELDGVANKLDEELAACLRVEQQLRDLESPGVGNVGAEYEQYS